MDKGLGSINWWGFSPSLDILDYLKHVKAIETSQEVNVLLVGSGDCRHTMKTLSRRIRHLKSLQKLPSIHFYVLENNLELYARYMIMMSILLRSPGNMGLQERTELLVEVYGNSLVRFQTAQFIQSMSTQLIKMVTDFEYLESKLPMLDLNLLKYKERDMLEGIFKLWRKAELEVFDMKQCWELRVRQHLGTRYDSAKGAFDWDYSMKLCDRGAEIIGSHNYQRWRKTGVAFQLREGTYDIPNKTLASGMILQLEGDRIGRRGYWGDIVVSPYISFGIECDDEAMFKKANRDFINSSETITQHNVASLIHEFQTGELYRSDSVQYDGVPASTADSQEANDAITSDTVADAFEFMTCDNVKVSFLPLNSLPDMAKKARYQHLFDAVVVGNCMVHLLEPPISDILADKALVALESGKFITELNKEQYTQFGIKIKSMAEKIGCETLIDFDQECDSFAFFKYSRDS